VKGDEAEECINKWVSVYFLGNVVMESAKDRREFGTKNMVYLHSFIWQQKRFVANYA